MVPIKPHNLANLTNVLGTAVLYIHLHTVQSPLPKSQPPGGDLGTTIDAATVTIARNVAGSWETVLNCTTMRKNVEKTLSG